MNPLIPKTRKPVLSRTERIQELALLGICLIGCIIFFVQVVLF